MVSDESLTGRASRALRNDLQNASSDMVALLWDSTAGSAAGIGVVCGSKVSCRRPMM
jgi:hypothetical protein